jgi:hypothetical protein
VEQPVFAASGVLKAFALELPKMRASQGPRLSLRGEAVEKRAMEMETMPYSWGTHLYSIGCLGSQHNIPDRHTYTFHGLRDNYATGGTRTDAQTPKTR